MAAKQEQTTTLTIGRNRGTARLWIQGRILSNFGWLPGRRWSMSKVGRRSVVISADILGKRKVAGNDARPVIDTKAAAISELFSVGDKVTVTVTKSCIHIRKANQ